jgi:hypothetical protein
MHIPRLSFAVILAAFLITACATGPKFSEYSATVKPVAPGYGRIWIYRPSKMAGAAVQPHVFLNGEKVGKAQPGCYFYVDRLPGSYEVKCTTEWSDIGKLTLAAGDEKYVRLGLMVGVVVGHVIPKEVSKEAGLREIAHCKLITAQ